MGNAQTKYLEVHNMDYVLIGIILIVGFLAYSWAKEANHLFDVIEEMGEQIADLNCEISKLRGERIVRGTQKECRKALEDNWDAIAASTAKKAAEKIQ